MNIHNEQVASHCDEPFKKHTVPVARAGCLHLTQWFVIMIIAGLYALIINYPSLAGAQAIVKVKGGNDLEIGHFKELASMAATWWLVAYLRSGSKQVTMQCPPVAMCTMLATGRPT